MVTQARPLPPAEALAAGLVDAVIPAADVQLEALAIARRTARWSRAAERSAKRAIAATVPRRAFHVEAAEFVSTATDAESMRHPKAFADASTPDGSHTPWRDRASFR